ncbi:MAG: hypothetical protein ACHQK9_01400 [Reyranellales bacterium]
MNRSLLTLALLAAATLAASAAQAQSKVMPTASPNPKGTVASPNATAEQAIVKDEIRSAGLTAPNSLQREADGSWHGLAKKNNVDVAVVVDRSGRVSTQ